MVALTKYRWRKTTDINRQHALFELLDEETPLLDVGYEDNGRFQISFNPSIGGTVIEWNRLQELIQEGKSLAEHDL